ncbi:TRC8 ring finger protein [Arctopsyche grandis]|uniref:TRC8 ring finger protein n=1 Tax=Arctopsyche grandis TaxID=121162 RepID=UPI00406D6658
MAVWARLATLAEAGLRVPPLFVVDELLKRSLGLPVPVGEPEADPITLNHNHTPDQHLNLTLFADAAISHLTETRASDDAFYYNVDFVKAFLYTFAKFLVCCCGFMFALSMFVLRMKHLIIMYMYLTSMGIIFVSYWANVAAMKQMLALSAAESAENVIKSSILEDALNLNMTRLVDPEGAGSIIIQNYVLQFVLGAVFYVINLGPRHWMLQYSLPWSFTIPSVIATLPFPHAVLQHAPVFAALLPLLVVKFVLWSSAFSVMQIVFSSYQQARNFASNFGLSALFEMEWLRLNVPSVLRLFWIIRVMEHASILLMDNYELSDDSFKVSTFLAFQTFASMAKSLLITGCETITAVLGMTSVISFFCHYIGNFFQWVLLTDEEEDRNIGTVSAILFYILALQTGLTSLNPEKRFVRLCRNFCLLFAALLHFVHNIVNPMLMSLSASHNPNLHRHVRALCVCAFLVTFPVVLLCYLWSNHTISTWLLAVSAFSIEVIVKVFVSIMIYALFLLDANRTTFWEKLDDYVYYIRAFGNTIEFCFGIFLFFNGAWILFFESGGAIRALMMCIHAYFNIWCEARAGWSVFMKRRSAVNKINSLPEASSVQLDSLDDVCAICYQEMSSAKITKCNHYFHGVCLRKWLYVQDRCPLCHDILYKLDKDGKDTGSESGSEAENINNENILEEDQAMRLGENIIMRQW